MTEKININKKRKKAIIILMIFFAPLIFMCIFVNFLAFGPPQSCKLVYMAQRTGFWGVWGGVMPEMPDNYTGIWKDWNEDGTIYSEGNYKNGYPIATTTFYNKNGTPSAIFNYDKDGKQHGLHIMYFSNEKIFTKSTWKHGKLIGKLKVWNKQGKLTMERWNENGGIKVKEYNTK